MKTTAVKLYQKPIARNRFTLFLDFFPAIPNPDTGKPTRREFLDLSLYSEIEYREEKKIGKAGNKYSSYAVVADKNGNPQKVKLSSAEKLHNRETLNLAENIRAKRQIDIQNRQYGFLSSKQFTADFVEYFQVLTNKRKGSNHDTWISVMNYIKKFTGGSLRFSELTEIFCNNFREYLLTAPSSRSDKQVLAKNSACSYFIKFKTALKQAYKDGYLSTDINAKIENIKPAETQREFLTLDELNLLVQAECEMPILKKAALFSALTGLRHCDIKKMLWGEIRQDKDKEGKTIYAIHFRQKKTDGTEFLPISEQAHNMLGERKESDEIIFSGLKYSAYANVYLKQWILRAGITKDITFHCFRHSFATIQLTLGTDIYTLKKLLCQRNIQNTQIYGKIVDEKKREAAEKIKLKM
ncbi:MAG: site-specific integrase [Bacteroidetes bacterium]|nr:site-specific integrase [Bacteroidota bacterium]